MVSYNEVLFYWFLTPSLEMAYLDERQKLWFWKDDGVDRAIRERFGEVILKAGRGELDDWAAFAKGRLALIILLDQFSRNAWRGTPQAFAQDPKALALCLEGLDKAQDKRLHPVERMFCYLPLEHSEDLEHQRRSVELFTQLAQDVPEEARVRFESFQDYAQRHYDIIARFGRFPHRNTILGRESTAEELAFLKLAGSSF